jgi:hydroxyacylglutathione hydrolase
MALSWPNQLIFWLKSSGEYNKMLLRYFYNQKLAQASYFVGCQQTEEAIVIDPARDIEPYLAAAEAEGMRIIAVTETHIHADFVSGSRELAERTGATLYLSGNGGEYWQYQYIHDYNHELVLDGHIFKVGNIRFEVLHTPGHTPEHIAFLLTDTAGADRPMGIFTGDFLFVGDVGRPDLLEKAANMADTAGPGAQQMFRSLARFKQLDDYLQVWPGHGAGSACGKDLGAIPSSTVGYEKLFNWALNQPDEQLFVDQLLAGQPEPPRYFAMMKKFNREGPKLLHSLALPEHLTLKHLEGVLACEALIVDTRPAVAFATGHIPGTINIPYEDSFANWAGWLVDYDKPFYLIAGQSDLAAIARDLASIGLDNCAGYFEIATVASWSAAGNRLQSYHNVFPRQVAGQLRSGEAILIDVRNESEWEEGHIPGARHIMLGYLAQRSSEIPAGKPIVVQCRSGRRSAIGASILQAQGISTVANLVGGIQDWEMAELPLSGPR